VMRRELGNRDSSQGGAQFLTEELGNILSAAEDAATKIIERARASTDQQIQEASRLWREVQAEVSRFTAWRERVDPAIGATHSHLEDVKTQVQEVPELIRHALAPLAEAISAFDADLAELGAAANPPLLTTPSGLDEAASGGPPEAPGGGEGAEGTEQPIVLEDSEPTVATGSDMGVEAVESSASPPDAAVQEEETGLWRRRKRTPRASAGDSPEASSGPLPAANYLPPNLGNA
jgi:hypothetical protein